MKKLTVHQFKEMIDNKEDYQLIDVREEWEHKFSNIGGDNIPQGQIATNTDKLDTEKKIVVYCRSGARSGNIVNYLSEEFDIDNAYNLEGGILAWARDIDNSVKTY